MYERRRKVMETDTIIHNDCLDALKDMPSESVHCCVTSPPYYGLRDYGMDGQVGREATPEQYIRKLTEIFFGSLPCTQGGRNLLAEYFRHILRYGEQRGL